MKDERGVKRLQTGMESAAGRDEGAFHLNPMTLMNHKAQ